MPRRRRHRRPNGPPRCQYCNAVITFFVSPKAARYRPFNPTPVAAGTAYAYPVMSRKAWDPSELIAELESLRHCTTEEAAAEINDMPWHQLHRCGEALAAWQEERERTRGVKT